jgi:hypothetical protein
MEKIMRIYLNRLFVLGILVVCLITVTMDIAMAATYDATGTWSFSTSNCWNNCGDQNTNETGSINIIQTGNSVTAIRDGIDYTGTVNGAFYTMSATYPEEGGTTEETVTFTLSSATSGSGSITWTWSQGGYSCNGGYDLTVIKNQNPATYDATGKWQYSESAGWTNCPGENPDPSSSGLGTITQTVNNVVYVDEDGTYTGTVNGATYTVSRSYPQDGGTVTEVYTITLTSDTTGSGILEWTWTDGENSCNGGYNSVIITKQSVGPDDYQCDLSHFYYLDEAGREISSAFSTDTLEVQNGQNTIVFSPTSVLQRHPSEPGVDYKLFAMSNAVPDSEVDLTNGTCTVGINNSGQANESEGLFPINFGSEQHRDWKMEVKFTNFRNLNQESRDYEFYIGNGMDTPHTIAWVGGTWWSGTYMGKTYENVLFLWAGIENENTGEEWESEEIVIKDLDPSQASVTLSLEIDNNGWTLIGKYKISDGAWHQIAQKSSPWQIDGHPDTVPYIEIEIEIANDPTDHKFNSRTMPWLMLLLDD